MPRTPKPWWRADRQSWYVTIAGERYNLGPDKAAAQEAFRRLQRQAEPVSGESLAGVIDQFLGHIQTHRKKRTYESYRDILKRVATQFGYDLPAAHLTGRMVSGWLDPQDWSKSYKGQVVRTLRCCYRWADGQGLISTNPLATLRGHGAQARDNLVPERHYRRMRRLANSATRLLLAMAWETGARPEELRTMEARHVVLAESRVILPPAEAKGGRLRVIYLSRFAEWIVRRLLARVTNGPLLRNSRGKPWTASSINCQMARVGRRIGHHYALYDFRHTFAHRLLAAGQDALTVATLMGHANAAMVANTYGKLTHATEHLSRAVRKKKT